MSEVHEKTIIGQLTILGHVGNTGGCWDGKGFERVEENAIGRRLSDLGLFLNSLLQEFGLSRLNFGVQLLWLDYISTWRANHPAALKTSLRPGFRSGDGEGQDGFLHNVAWSRSEALEDRTVDLIS